MTSRFTSNIQKGGALLDDARRLVEVWDPDENPEVNLVRIANENLLAKTSRARADDVLLRILRPRLVDPGPQVIAALKELLAHPATFRTACYYEATRDEALLAAFAEGPVADRHDAGMVTISIQDTVDWLLTLEKDGQVRAWSDTIRMKVARGLLAALRDFGVLTGAVHKEIAAPSISVHGFAYVAFRLYEQGASSRALLTSPVWRRWLLDGRRVDELFRQADHAKLLRYAAAGSVVRVDWLVESLPEVVRDAD
jgi:hypothetical protein